MKTWLIDGCERRPIRASFSTARGVVELIDGPNAAGKSTIARAEIALLFGIPQQTDDAHTFAYQDLAIGAELLIDHHPINVVRRKAKVGSLRDRDGNVLRDDPIPAALGGLSREIYQSFFHVDHDTLVSGGEDLLQGKGEIGMSLFAAAAGMSALHERLATFDQRADEVFRPRASSTALMQELHRLREHEKQLREFLVRPATHRRMVQDRDRLQTQSQQLLDRIFAAGQKIAELERLLEAGSLIAELTTLTLARSDLGVVPELAANAAESRASAETTLRSEVTRRDEHRRERDRLSEQEGSIVLDEALLACASQIRAICEQIPVVQKAEGDRRRIELQLRQAHDDLDVVLAAIGIPTGELPGLRRPDSARRKLDATLAEGERFRERLDVARQRERAARDAQTELLGQTAPDPAPRDLSALEAGLRVARARTGLDDQLAHARHSQTRRQTEAARALATLSPPPGSLEELLDLPTLPTAALDSLFTRSQAHHDDTIHLQADRRQLAARKTDLAGLVEEVRQQGHVITAAQVSDARGTRDELWTRLRGSLQNREVPDPASVDRYEATVAHADEHADALARNAAGAELAKRMAVERAQIAATEADLLERQASVDDRATAVARDWARVWASTGLAPIELEQFRDWRETCEDAQATARAAQDATDAVAVLAEQLTGSTEAMRGHLAGEVGGVSERATLAELVELADGVIDHNAQLTSATAEHQRRLALAEQEISAAAQDLSAAQRQMDAWDAAWPLQRQAAGLPGHCAPEDAQELVRNMGDGLAAQRSIEGLQARLDGIDRDREELQQRLDGQLAVVAPDLLGQELWQAVAVLKDRRAKQERNHEKREELRRRRAEADAAAVQAERAADNAHAELTQLCRMAGCDSADELPGMERRCQAAAELDRELRELERRIVERGRDSLDALTERTLGLDPEQTSQTIAELGNERRALEAERDGLQEQIGQAKLGIAEAEQDTTAVSAAQDVEFSQARIVELARRYALDRLSGSVLRRAVERYRDHNQNPLVARANALFGRFTEGTYAELFVDLDEKNRACLVARRFDRVIHTMDKMSKGTREQLFLALRIAAIERYVDLSGPVPVVFDDVFVESDDARCAQIFTALGELSRRTQVIVLTHHHHLVAIARGALGAQLNVQELPAAHSGLRAAA